MHTLLSESCWKVLAKRLYLGASSMNPMHSCFFFFRLKADKELVKEVYSAAKRLKMERVKQVRFKIKPAINVTKSHGSVVFL